MILLTKIIESLICLLLGVVIIIARRQILQISIDYALRKTITFPDSQQKIVVIIIWIIGIGFFLGGFFRLLKTILNF